MDKYMPPGFLQDFDQAKDPKKLYDAWHQRINDQIKDLARAKNPLGGPMYPRFYSPLKVPEGGGDPQPASISWHGFPRKISAWLKLDDNSDPEDWEDAFLSAEPLEEWALCSLDRRIARLPYRPEAGFFNCFAVPGTNQLDLNTMFSVKARLHDEYLEWHTTREAATGKVTKMTFTAEPPEYWETIAHNDEDLLVSLYRRYIDDDSVERDDLYWPDDVLIPIVRRGPNGLFVSGFTRSRIYAKGTYNQFNKWNTTHGAMHLIQRANTLGAEINLAADATLQYEIRSQLAPADPLFRFKLAACATYGGINRNSDPTIGHAINSAVMQDKALTISNPMGLYIGRIQLEGLRDPHNRPLGREDVYQDSQQRGDPGSQRLVRFELRPPQGAGYGLEQCTMGDFKLAYGGPVARNTTIMIHGETVNSAAPNSTYRCAAKLCAHQDKTDYYDQIDVGDDCKLNQWTAPFREIPTLMSDAEPVAAENEIRIMERELSDG